ncbi:hypothetical protein GCM10027180_00400 [Microbulbifer echini]
MVFPGFDFLNEHAQEESALQHSGMIIADFDLMPGFPQLPTHLAILRVIK